MLGNLIFILFGSRKLRHILTQRLGLKKRRHTKPTERTPPAAHAYCTPNWWLEGDICGHVITFWGKFTRDTFTGEILIGAYGFYSGGSRVSKDKDKRWSTPGTKDYLIPSVAALLQLGTEEKAVKSVETVLKGVCVQVEKADAQAIERILQLAPPAIEDLLSRKVPPLLAAVDSGDIVLAEKLLKEGADPEEYGPDFMVYNAEKKWTTEKTPLLTALYRNDAAMTSLVARYSTEWKKNPGFHILVALDNKANDSLRALLEAGAPPMSYVPVSLGADTYAVEYAASKDNIEAVRMLLHAVGPLKYDHAGVLKAARFSAAGSRRREIREFLAKAIAGLPAPPPRPPFPFRRLFPSLASQVITIAFVVGGVVWAGESPRIAIYGFFMNYIYKLITIGVLFKVQASQRPEYRQWAEKFTRRPHPDRLSLPIMVTAGNTTGPGKLWGYLVLMAGLFMFTFLEVNTADGKIATQTVDILNEVGWAVGIALIWWLQDLYDRRIIMNFSEPLTANLGYNSAEAGIVALTVLTGGIGGAWPYLAMLLFFKHINALNEDVKWPAG